MVWTKSALSRIYGSFEKPSEKKKGYVLPRADGEDGENCHREKTWKKRFFCGHLTKAKY